MGQNCCSGLPNSSCQQIFRLAGIFAKERLAISASIPESRQLKMLLRAECSNPECEIPFYGLALCRSNSPQSTIVRRRKTNISAMRRDKR
jgi:hypothetical protein